MGTPAKLRLLSLLAACVASAMGDWSKGTATFYGGKDASGTMGGPCGYDNLYNQGYGVWNAALSTVLFKDGASCGECYLIMCDTSKSKMCKPGAATITATNLCPPNWALPSNNGGWCNTPRPHFDMSQPSWETIGIYRTGIIPILYQKVKCWRQGRMRFSITGFKYFQLVLITNVAGSGSIQSMSVKGTNTGWITMNRYTGAQTGSATPCSADRRSPSRSPHYRNRTIRRRPAAVGVHIWPSAYNPAVGVLYVSCSASTGGQTVYLNNVVPAWWTFGGQTYASNNQFDY